MCFGDSIKWVRVAAEPRLHLPITKDTLAKAVKLGSRMAEELRQAEGRLLNRLRSPCPPSPALPYLTWGALEGTTRGCGTATRSSPTPRSFPPSGRASTSPARLRSSWRPPRSTHNSPGAGSSTPLWKGAQVLIRGEGLNELEKLPKELDPATLQKLLPQVDVSQVILHPFELRSKPISLSCRSSGT